MARAPRPLAPSDKTDQSWSIISFTITKHQLEVLYPPSFGSSAGVQGPELMMMSAMMAAGQLELLQERLAICCQGASQGCRQLLRDLLGHYAPGSARRANVVFSDCTEAEVYI